MNQPYRSIDELPEHLRNTLPKYGITHKLWSGILMFCCSFPYCLVMSEDPRFMLRHAQEHGIRPTPDQPAESKSDETVIHQGETLVISPEVSSIASENSDEERNIN